MSDERVERLRPDQAVFLALSQIQKNTGDLTRILGDSTKGQLWSRSQTVDTNGPTDLKGKDITPDDKAWRSLSVFNNGSDVITVEVLTRADVVDKLTKRLKTEENWQRPVTVRKNFEMKLAYNEPRILALRVKAQSSSATVDINLAR